MERMLGLNANKMKRLKRQIKLQPSPEQSPKKMREDLPGTREKASNKMQQNDFGFKSEFDHSVKILRSEITQIFQIAKEEATNTVENIFEKAKMNAEAAIQKIVSQNWFVNYGQAGQFEISSEVNKMSLNDMSSCFSKTIDEMTKDQSDIKLSSIDDNTEDVIKDNLNRFEAYISDCVKTTDLIVFFRPFSSEQTKELRSIYKHNPVEATNKALKMIQQMANQPRKYRQLLEALTDAGYPKVVQILDGTLLPVGNYQRDILRECAKHIFQLLNTSELLPYLFSKGVINNDDKEQILKTERHESTGIAVIELLHMLPNRHKRWFKYFIQSLKESGHNELAKIIEDGTDTYNMPKTDMKGTGIPREGDNDGETVNPIITKPRRALSRLKPKLLFPSDFQNTIIENNIACVSQTHDLHDKDKESDKQRPDRIPSPISVSSDDYSCIQAARLDHGLDFSDSSFPLDE